MAQTTSGYTIDFEVPANGRVKKATVYVRDAAGEPLTTDEANLLDARERKKLSGRLAAKLGADPGQMLETLEAAWTRTLADYQRTRKQAAAGSAEASAAGTAQLLDDQAEALRRPLCLAGGRSYAAAWCPVRRTTPVSLDAAGQVVRHDPPLVTVEDLLVVVRGDGVAFADADDMPEFRPVAELGLPVQLPNPPRPGRGWSGAGVKRYVAGDRPRPADVFARLVAVADRFLHFERSLAPQESMCELVACYVVATYLLEAFHVVGYLWPNGGAGCGKTTLLQVVTETGYLGELILASSSCATLRDLADYGATLAFDDAEAVMDVRRSDPDKRTLLLAGNRRGVSVAVKELVGDRWVTRHVNTYCPRSFSAIRLPDEVLGSRSIVLPLVRSGDPARTKANVLDYGTWPCDRRRLVDDLWALGLANLPELPAHDVAAAASARLAGRDLEPWRAVLGVAHWLQEGHRAADLFARMERLSVAYQRERNDFEPTNPARLLAWALIELVGDGAERTFSPKEVAGRMKEIADREEVPDPCGGSPNKVGWLLRKLRFRRPEGRNNKGKEWVATRAEVENLARAYGVEAPKKEQAAGREGPAAADVF